jgi:hydrogenase nickel incorporation protein HypA/HybF
MHEYTLIEQVVETIISQISREAKPGEVLGEVILTVGALEMHSEESFRQAFQLLSRGTPLESSRLGLRVAHAGLDCPDCGYNGEFIGDDDDIHAQSPFSECPSCGKVIPVNGGKGVRSIELIFDQGAT